VSEFANKYNLTEIQMKALIKDGWLSCSIPTYDAVIIHYKESRSMQKTADEFNISKAVVHKIVHRF
jgi:hypothetical protein